ncbi:hypothetical protein JCM3766R1_005977 [Sporobolomyces carnicolor]
MSWVNILALSNKALDDRSLKAAFPSLRALTLDGDITPGFDASSLESVLGSLSQQFDVIMARIDFLRSPPSIFTALKDKTLFDIHRYWLTRPATRPVNARLLYDPDDAHDVAHLPEFVLALATEPDLSQLSLLYLPSHLHKDRHLEPEEHWARQRLLEICGNRKIEVVFEDTPGNKYLDSFVSRDFWRRRRELRRKDEGL